MAAGKELIESRPELKSDVFFPDGLWGYLHLGSPLLVQVIRGLRLTAVPKTKELCSLFTLLHFLSGTR